MLVAYILHGIIVRLQVKCLEPDGNKKSEIMGKWNVCNGGDGDPKKGMEN